MTYDEFDLNKDLLREIVQKKKVILSDIEMQKKDQVQREIDKPKPTYEVFNI